MTVPQKCCIQLANAAPEEKLTHDTHKGRSGSSAIETEWDVKSWQQIVGLRQPDSGSPGRSRGKCWVEVGASMSVPWCDGP